MSFKLLIKSLRRGEESRYDVTILINGLPLVQIERAEVELKQGRPSAMIL